MMKKKLPIRYVTLKIPNWEIDYIFREKVRRWFIDDGYTETKRYGVAFCKKDCLVIAG